MMETLGTSHPRFWILEQPSSLHHHPRDFPATTPCIASAAAAAAAATMPSEHVSLGRNVECVAELQQPCPPYNIAPPLTTTTTSAPECRARDADDHGHLPPARKLQKAGRERLRRDQLNEQFAKLADVLDPIRPRNDKGSILAESILAVNELRAEISRMKSEHITLSEESRDLSAEKSELQEEKTHLQTETNRLEGQVKQSVESNNNNNNNSNNQNAVPGFLPGLAQFPYHLMMKAALPSKEIILQDAEQMPVSPFFSVAPFLHPAYQAYGMLGSRQPSPFGNGSPFPHPAQQIHVERPAARYPVPIHPTPVYPFKAVKASDPSVVVTELQLQTPGLVPSSKSPRSVSDQEPCENTTSSADQDMDDLEDAGSKGVTSADKELPSQLSLSSNSTLL